MQTEQTTAIAAKFRDHLKGTGFDPLTKGIVRTAQINLGRRCNQRCAHCHVDAGPDRTEVMGPEGIERMIHLVKNSPDITVVDLTGGAPELNPGFEKLVLAMRGMGREVIDRCNLTVLSEPGMENRAAFLAKNGVKIVASLPCYTAENVDGQRGGGVFNRSISALLELNRLGYGRPGTGLELDLVYNPGGAFLPGPQAALEADYKAQLGDRFGIEFNHLRTIVNMPINRFSEQLSTEKASYMGILVDAFNPATVGGVMCRSMVSISWDGTLYDCDFNQVVDIPMTIPMIPGDDRKRITIFDIESFSEANKGPIATASHCFGCTAGSGSSCSGAIADCGDK